MKESNKSSTFSRQFLANFAHYGLGVFFLLMSNPAVAEETSDDYSRIIVYLSNEGIRSLAGCSWDGSTTCRGAGFQIGSRADFYDFFSRADAKHFSHWRNAWENKKSRDGILIHGSWLAVWLLDSSDPYSAVLTRSHHSKVFEVFKIRQDGRELEFKPIEKRAGPASRDLIRVSTKRIKNLLGCGWGQVCDRVFYREKYIETRLVEVHSFFGELDDHPHM